MYYVLGRNDSPLFDSRGVISAYAEMTPPSNCVRVRVRVRVKVRVRVRVRDRVKVRVRVRLVLG